MDDDREFYQMTLIPLNNLRGTKQNTKSHTSQIVVYRHCDATMYESERRI